MAKLKDLGALISDEEQTPEPPRKKGAAPAAHIKKGWRSIGVALSSQEVDELDTIAEQHDVTRNSVLRYAIRRFLLEYEMGAVDLKTKPTRSKRLKMP